MWTESQTNLMLKLNTDKLPLREISKIIGISRNAIIGKLFRLKIPIENKQPKGMFVKLKDS
jgi:hypothetical protein